MLDIRYLAGLFDGEGCVHIAVQNRPDLKMPSYSIRAIVCMTHKELIVKIAEQFNVGWCKIRKPEGTKDAFQVQICGPKAAAFFREIYPYLIVKREVVEVALKLQDDIERYTRRHWMKFSKDEIEAIRQYRHALKLQTTALNRRGCAPDGMVANSVELLCPVSDDADGQSRAKQELH